MTLLRGRDAVDPARIRELLDFHEPADVAVRLGIPLAQVEEVLERTEGPRVQVVLVCNRTGRVWRCRSWRRAYYTVCLVGLTDWTWCTAAEWAAVEALS